MTLAEFLLTRIAEDEAAARDCGGSEWVASEEEFGTFDVSGRDEEVWRWPYLSEDKATHIARWDPARVLAEGEVKRRIVRNYLGARRVVDEAPGTGSVITIVAEQIAEAHLRDIRALALLYASHPDYDEAWRP